MRIVTSGFKDALIESGREFDCQIIYTINGTTTTLGLENIYNVNYSYKASILKSIMKQLEFESDENIPLKTNLEYRIGLKVNDAYEYISYGTFIVKEVEYKEDTNTYLITCYDKMLYAMTDYVDLGITYPITIRSYINAICSHLGLTFKNANSTFTNYNRQIPSELYLDSNGNTLYYSFRDVLDELAQVTASCICINEDDDELEIRYVNNTNETLNSDYLKDINIKKTYKEYGPINCVELCRSADSDMIYEYDELSEREHGLTTIRISNNQILNGEDRENYLHEIYERVDGITYSLCDLSSYGILYFDLLDKFPISWTDENNETHTINVLMLNDDITQKQMVEERIQIEEPLTAFVDYGEKTKEVKNDNRAKIEVDKVNGRVEAIVQNIGDDGEVTGASLLLAINNDESLIKLLADKIALEGYTTINGNFQIDENGNATLSHSNIELYDIPEGQGFQSALRVWRILGENSYYLTSIYSREVDVEAHSEEEVEGQTIVTENLSSLGTGWIRLENQNSNEATKHIDIKAKDTNGNSSIKLYNDRVTLANSNEITEESIILKQDDNYELGINPYGIYQETTFGGTTTHKDCAWEQDFAYSSGDYTFNSIHVAGCVTGSTQQIVFTIPVSLSLKNIRSITPVSGSVTARGTAGYVESSGTSPYLSMTNTSSYTYTCSKSGDYYITIGIAKKSGTLSNVTNNTPVNVLLRSVKLRFTE